MIDMQKQYNEHEEIKRILDRKKKISFIKEAQDSVTEAETMGLLLAHYFDWDGKKITQAYLDALEDANFHKLRAKVVELAKKEEDLDVR